MCSMRVLALLALLVASAHSFSWDIVVGEDERLNFYYNGTLTHTEDIRTTSIIYDPVHYRVLFTYDYSFPNVSISSFDLSTRKIQPLVTTDSDGYVVRVVYDPVTQLLIWKQYQSIYSFSLNPASSNKADDGNLLVTLDNFCCDIAVDSCGGYIYWITDFEVERARFDGSERSVLIDDPVHNRGSLAIDQQTQKMYWTETKRIDGNYQLSIESADLNGKNRTQLHIIARKKVFGYSLAVSKDFIYWKNYKQVGIWQLPKILSQDVAGKLFSISSSQNPNHQRIAANYTIQEQIHGSKRCEALQRLISNGSKPESSVSICQNYCFQGDCSVSAEGHPSCSCKAGYSGQRCEVNACHKHCLNNGVCSLNEQAEPVCQCTAYNSGERCNIPAFLIKCIQTISVLKDMLNTGPYISGYLCNVVGRKPCLYFGGGMLLLSYLMLALAKGLVLVYIARTLVGVGTGVLFVTNIVYIAELASTRVRGTLLTLTGFSSAIGILLVYSVGPFVSYAAINWIAMSLTAAYLAGLFVFVPETAVFQVMKGKKEEAMAILTSLGRQDDIDEIVSQANEKPKPKIAQLTEMYTVKTNRRAAFIIISINVLSQFSGMMAVIAFVTVIFDMTGSDMEAHISTIIIGVTQVLESVIALVLVDRTGRKILLLFSCAACSLSLASLGTYFYLYNNGFQIAEDLQWLSLVSVMVFCVAYYTGMGIIPNTFTGEMFTDTCRGFGGTITATIGFVFGFGVSTTFGYVLPVWGPSVVFWIFSGACAFTFFFTVIFVPETKGKSLLEIRELLRR